MARSSATETAHALRREVRTEQNRKSKATGAKLARELRAARDRRDKALGATRALLHAARQTCALRKDEARAKTGTALARAKAELDAERRYQADLRRIEAGNRKRRAALPKTTRAERQSESDDAVRANLAPDLLPLFEKVKRSLKGSARESRTEAFLRYAEEHRGEVLEALEDDGERLVRDREALDRSARRPTAKVRPRAPRQDTDVRVAGVPF